MMRFICGDTPFELNFHILSPRQHGVIYEDDSLIVECFPLYHRVPTLGYIFREKPKPRHVRGDMIRFHGVPHYKVPEIKAGADFITPEGKTIANALLTSAPEPAMSYAYCSDTIFDPRVARAVAVSTPSTTKPPMPKPTQPKRGPVDTPPPHRQAKPPHRQEPDA